MMARVDQMAVEIVDREGGFVNDPDDPGGATKFGVTIGTMRRLGLDLDRDGAITVSDVKRLTRDQAVDIFMDGYYRKPGIWRLPEQLQPSVFDMYVNAGAGAVRILQRLAAEYGRPLTVDGVIGPKTAGAVEEAFDLAPPPFEPGNFVDAYGIARRNYYFRIADRRPASRKYCVTRAGGKGGWIKRAEEFITPRYHLSEAEFRARISSWR